jgi:hypothetical protein
MQHPKRDGLDFGNTGRQWRLQRRRRAERHQRTLIAIGRRRFVRAARHVIGHISRVVGYRCHRHRSHAARIRPRRERGDDEADDHEDRQQPAKMDRAFHSPSFAHPSLCWEAKFHHEIAGLPREYAAGKGRFAMDQVHQRLRRRTSYRSAARTFLNTATFYSDRPAAVPQQGAQPCMSAK